MSHPASTPRHSRVVEPGTFDAAVHFYTKVLNAQVHPLVSSFLKLGNKRIATRYCHLHPMVQREKLLEILNYKPHHFAWAGADLFNVASPEGNRQMVIIETNSCPSGQKSMPHNEEEESAGYHKLLKNTFMERLKEAEEAGTLIEGGLAVIYDKNEMEASGYAAELATLTDEPVHLVEYYQDDEDPPCRWTEDGVLSIRTFEGEWVPIRACFRYVTQRPWSRIPLVSKTLVLNPIVACLAGGRNKAMASKAYDFYNAELEQFGLQINMPDTVKDVTKPEVPLYVKSMGGHAVVKVPYSNAGQGVYTITCKQELDAFMAEEHSYDKFIVQSLIGNSNWTSVSRQGQLYHAGTVPDRKGKTFVADLRMMVGGSPTGFRPIVVYARRARKPLINTLEPGMDSWDMLGTNLSVKTAGVWSTDSTRLLLMDTRDFNKLGIGIDDLINAYVQTVLCTIAIDRMSHRLMGGKSRPGVFQTELFASLNEDASFLEEIMGAAKPE